MNRPPNSLSLRHYGNSHGSHAHSHFQVLLGLDGVLELEVQGHGQRISAGDGCVIAPGERHDFQARSGSHCLVLDTGHSAWADCHGSPARADLALALAGYLRLALAQQDTLAITHAPLLLLNCWRTPPLSPARSQRLIDWQALTEWAQTHLHEPLTVADLARQVFLSPTQFAARCRRELGLSSMRWLQGLRLARARQLRASGLGLAQVAGRCGYQSASALGAALRAGA